MYPVIVVGGKRIQLRKYGWVTMGDSPPGFTSEQVREIWDRWIEYWKSQG